MKSNKNWLIAILLVLASSQPVTAHQPSEDHNHDYSNQEDPTPSFPSNLVLSPIQGILLIVLFQSVSLLGLSLGHKMRVIGLTGGIACGKSTVTKMLAQEGFTIIDADKISHELRAKNKTYQRALIKEFGDQVWDEDKKQIRSDVLGGIVFSDRDKRRRLESMTNWRIFAEMMWQIFHAKVLRGERLVVLDAPTLFETKVLEYFCYPIVVVWIDDEEKQLERLMLRNGLTREEATKRIEA